MMTLASDISKGEGKDEGKGENQGEGDDIIATMINREHSSGSAVA